VNGTVVVNTGPIIALAIVDRLGLLHSIFDEVLVPAQAHVEILEGGESGAGVTTYQRADWIKRRLLRDPLDPLVESLLDIGEASVIQLAREAGTDRVLIDERKARKIARDVYGLKVVGSAGIIVEAKRRGLLDSVQDELSRMKEHGYWIQQAIIDAAMSAAGET
jgi:predicted nucleic acid-binding protein